MSRPTPDAIVTQIVQLLAALDVTTFSTHQGLRDAVLDLIDRSAKDFRDEVVERIDRRVHKKPRNHTKEEAQLLAFLDENNSSVSANSKKVIERLGKALRGLQSSLHVRDDEFKIPGGKQTGQSSNATSFVETTGCRQARIMQHYRMCEQKTHVNEGWRRLYRLWVVYEVDRLMSERTEPEKSEVADAVREFCRLFGENEEIVREIRAKSQSYVTAANRENGLGIILMLGSRTTDAWERGRILDDDAVSWLWASCVSKHSELKYKAEVLQRVACAVIRQGFLEYGIELAELLEEGHIFTRHFKAEAAPRNSPAGLQVLADAIDQVESSRVGSASDNGQDQSTQDSQAQQQIRARDEGLIAGQVAGLPPTQAESVPVASFGQQAPWQVYANQGSPASPGVQVGPPVSVAVAGQAGAHEPGSTSGNSQHGLAVDTRAQTHSRLGAWNEGLIAGQVPRQAPYKTNLNPTTTYSQDTHFPWQTSLLQQTAAQHVSPDGSRNRPLFQFDQSETAMGSSEARPQDDSGRQVGGLPVGSNIDVSGARIDRAPDLTRRTSVLPGTNMSTHGQFEQTFSHQWPQDAASTNLMGDQTMHLNSTRVGDNITELDNVDWNNLFAIVSDDLGERFNR